MTKLVLCLLALGLLAGFSLGEKLKQVKEQQCSHYRYEVGSRPLCIVIKQVKE